jgi:hypothetical protein
MFKAKGTPRTLIGDEISAKTGVATATTDITIVSITSASPAVVTATSHGLSAGDVILIPAGTLTEMTELNGREFVIHTVATNTFQLYDENGDVVDSTDYTAESTGGDVTLLESEEGSVTMTMNGASVAVDFSKAWNILDFDYGDVFVGGYVVSYQTDETSDVSAAEWMYMPKAVFDAHFVVDGL